MTASMKKNGKTIGEPTRVPREGERGMGLVEMAISVSLTVAILGVTYTAADVVHSVNRWDQAKLKQDVAFRDALRLLRKELKMASVERDPKTNQSRYRIYTNAKGQMVLRIQTVSGAKIVSGELEPDWSSDISFHVDAKGRLVRTQDGEARIMGSGFKGMYFEVTDKGFFRITAEMEILHPKTHKPMLITKVFDVKPLN